MPDVLQTVKSVIREPYAWPGGYPLYTVMSDGGCLCPACCKTAFRLIVSAELRRDNTGGWRAAGVEVNWEDAALSCDGCGNFIPSAYSEDDGESDITDEARPTQHGEG
jgi:cell wall-associated NlpC family hydrolase